MKIANLIIAHKNPMQLERMIKAFGSNYFHYFIHLDAKADISEFNFISEIPNVRFLKNRYSVNWAGFRGVQATLDGFDEILNSGYDFDYVNLLTGQDYPIKPIDEFVAYLQQHKGKEFFEYQHSETEWLESCHRFQRYHFTELTLKGRYRLEDIANFILSKRKRIFGYEIYGRSAYFTITLDCVKFISDFVKTNKKYVDYFKMVWGADEMFFQTLLLNSTWKDKLVNNNLRHIVWFPKIANPKIFTATDYDELVNSDKFIARKFDNSKDVQILDLLDKHISTK